MNSIEVVSREVHAQKRWRRTAGYQFAAADSICPLVLQELPKALMSLPIAFVASGETYSLVAVQGLAAHDNLLVAPDGAWKAGYIPAAYRSHPFSLAADDAGRELLCIATSSIADSVLPGAESFFEESGELSAAVKEILQFQAEYSRNRKATDQLCTLLKKHDLIVPWPLTVETPSGKVTLDGLHRVDEARIAGLSSEALCELRDAGGLGVIYCQLLAMQNIVLLRNLLEARARQVNTTASPFDIGLLRDSGTLSFEGL